MQNFEPKIATPSTNRGLVNVACCVLGLASSYIVVAVFAFSTFLLPIASETGWSRAAVSGSLAVVSAVVILASPVVGWLTDRFGARAVIVPSTALLGICVASLWLVGHSLMQFYAIFFLIGLSGAGTSPVPFARLVIDWFEHRQGLALGIALSGIGIGAAAIPALSGALIAHIGWRSAFLVIGLSITFLVTPILAMFIVERSHASHGQKVALAGYTLRQASYQGSFRLMAAGFLLIGLGVSAGLTHYVPILIENGVAPGRASELVGLTGLSIIAGRIAAGYLMDRIFAPFVTAAFLAAPVVGYLLIASVGGPSIAIFGAICVGIALGAEFDVIAFFTIRYFGNVEYGQIYAAMFALFNIGAGLGPALMGAMHDRVGSYNLGLYVAGGVILTAIVFILRLGRYPALPAISRQAAAP